MQIKHTSKKKQELRRDPLVESLVRAREALARNSAAVTSVVIVVAFAAVFLFVYNSMRQSSLRKAQEAFGQAMVAYMGDDQVQAVEQLTIVADNHKGTPHAVYSAYLLGTIALRQGKTDEAVEWLEVAHKGKDAGFVNAAAAEALAGVYESRGELETALEYARKALQEEKLSHRHAALRWKMALVNQQLKRFDQAQEQCEALMADTAATQYHKKATTLLAQLRVAG